MIPLGTKLFLIQLARLSPRKEVCGFLFKDWAVWPIKNISDSESEFEMDHEETIEVFNSRYDEVMGVFHSHPGGSIYPSWDDVQHAPPGLRYFIVTNDDVIEWRIADDRTSVERADQRSPDMAGTVRGSADEDRPEAGRIAGEGEQGRGEEDQAASGEAER